MERNDTTNGVDKAGMAAGEEEAEKDADDIFELAKAMALAAVIALAIRSLLFEPFNIPSGSMLPTLLVGDYLFVEKYAYGYSRYSFPLGLLRFNGRIFENVPERGDIAVFRQPKNPEIDYIKRIIGLPGDTVQVREGILFLNGEPVPRDYRGSENYEEENVYTVYQRYVETLPDGGLKHSTYEISDMEPYDDTPVFEVPKGYYFAMGDNRDSSLDSRATAQVGLVPAENLVGRAYFIFFSTEGLGAACHREGMLALVRSIGCRLVSWPGAIRYRRLFKTVDEL